MRSLQMMDNRQKVMRIPIMDFWSRCAKKKQIKKSFVFFKKCLKKYMSQYNQEFVIVDLAQNNHRGSAVRSVDIKLG